MSDRWKTGYYTRDGRNIYEGDRVKAIFDGQIITGIVTQDYHDDEWFIACENGLTPSMWAVDYVEVLK